MGSETGSGATLLGAGSEPERLGNSISTPVFTTAYRRRSSGFEIENWRVERHRACRVRCSVWFGAIGPPFPPGYG
jgi:hypothetical protein